MRTASNDNRDLSAGEGESICSRPSNGARLRSRSKIFRPSPFHIMRGGGAVATRTGLAPGRRRGDVVHQRREEEVSPGGGPAQAYGRIVSIARSHDVVSSTVRQDCPG